MTTWRPLSMDEFWRALGLSPEEQVLYEAMIGAPADDALAVARRLGRSTAAATAQIEALRERRLVHTARGHTRPVDPRVALTSLARSKQALLDRAGTVADELGATLAAGRLEADPFRYFEILRGPVEIVGRIRDLLHTAEREAVGTVAPPYVAGGDDSLLAAEVDLLARGVGFRSLYDTTVLEHPDHLDRMRQLERAGECARVRRELQVKLLIVDGTAAVVPLARTPDRPEPSAIVLGPSTITDALALLFEMLWERSRPISLTDDETAEQPRRGLDRPHRQVLQLLGNGMADSAVAAALDISERTLRRRIAALQAHFGASNRFQLGVAAATASRPGRS